LSITILYIEPMKKILFLIAATTIFTASTGYCRPGGWFIDLLKNNNCQANVEYRQSDPVYYQQAPTIYYTERRYMPEPVYIERIPSTVYYTERCYRPAPVYYTQPYNCHQRYNNCW
jgi:hypothetical protein